MSIMISTGAGFTSIAPAPDVRSVSDPILSAKPHPRDAMSARDVTSTRPETARAISATAESQLAAASANTTETDRAAREAKREYERETLSQQQERDRVEGQLDKLIPVPDARPDRLPPRAGL